MLLFVVSELELSELDEAVVFAVPVVINLDQEVLKVLRFALIELVIHGCQACVGQGFLCGSACRG